MHTLFKFDRELLLQMDFSQVSEAITMMSQEHDYLSFDEMYTIKSIEIMDNSVVFSGDVDKAVPN